MKRLFDLINKNLGNSILLRRYQRKNTTSLPMITISREKGSGGRPIAYLVTKMLGKPWKIYHKGIIDEMAEETALAKEAVEDVDEGKTPIVTQLLNNILGKKYLTLNEYYKHLLHILAGVGNRGYAVVVGRGANFLFPRSLKVRIVATMKTRIDWVMKYEKVTYKEAVKRIEESDKKRIEFTKTLFQHDQRKSHHYDLIIRTGDDMSVEDAADLIVYTAKKKFSL